MEIKTEPIDGNDIGESCPPKDFSFDNIQISDQVNVKIEIDDYFTCIDQDQIEVEYENPNYLSNCDFDCNENFLPLNIKSEPSDILKKLSYCQDCTVPITRLGILEESISSPPGKVDLKITSVQSLAKAKSKKRIRKKSIRQTPSTRSDKRFICHVCKKGFKTKSNLEIHLRVHTGEKPYKCTLCPKSFAQISSQKHHMGMHENYRPFPCTFCSRTFREKIKLASHTRTHTGEKPYKCTHCPKLFSDQSACTRHIRIHTGEKPHKCEECSKKFSDSAALWRHKKMHTGEKNIICKTCGKGFSVLHTMKIHAASHTDVRYPCTVCKKAYRTQAILKKHEKEKKHYRESEGFDCKICNIPFAGFYGLSVHNLTFHEIKDKLFKCSMCKMKFTERATLTKHIKDKNSGHKVNQKKKLKKNSKKI